MSLGQFMQFVGAELMASGTVQIWPGMPVDRALVEDGRVRGVRLSDQGVDREGNPEAGFMPGMDVRAALTVVATGRWEPSAASSTSNSGCRRVITSASGPWA